jgi:signal transduction histidine kinase
MRTPVNPTTLGTELNRKWLNTQGGYEQMDRRIPKGRDIQERTTAPTAPPAPLQRIETDTFPDMMKDLPVAMKGILDEQDVPRSEVLVKLHGILRSIAHDLRTPLSTIANCLEIIDLRPSEAGRTDQMMEQIRSSTQRMSEMIKSMLEQAREGADLPEAQWVDMPRLLERVRNEVSLSQPAGCRTVNIKLGNAPWVHGDPVRLGQVFTNIISNAVKFSRSARTPWVQVAGEIVGSEIHYSVSDNGIGIEDPGSGDLFEPFTRMKNALDFEGSGVGLSVVKEIMDEMKGRIWFNSEPGVRTCFHLAFPKDPIPACKTA